MASVLGYAPGWAGPPNSDLASTPDPLLRATGGPEQGILAFLCRLRRVPCPQLCDTLAYSPHQKRGRLRGLRRLMGLPDSCGSDRPPQWIRLRGPDQHHLNCSTTGLVGLLARLRPRPSGRSVALLVLRCRVGARGCARARSGGPGRLETAVGMLSGSSASIPTGVTGSVVLRDPAVDGWLLRQDTRGRPAGRRGSPGGQ